MCGFLDGETLVQRLQTDITTLLNTFIVQVLSCYCCLNSNALKPQLQCIELPQLHVIVNHYHHEMSIKVLGMLPPKSTVQSDLSGSFLFLPRISALICRWESYVHATTR